MTEWVPRTRPAAGCVCTILSSNLLEADLWGAAAMEIARNWAVAHGYRFVRFSETASYNTSARLPSALRSAENSKAAQYWLKPQAMLFLLERRSNACPWVFFLDSDAVVNNVRRNVSSELLVPYLTPRVHVLFNCHTPFGQGGDCLTCRCCRAGLCSPAERTRLPQGDGTWINTGAVFIRNSDEGREMLRWWASAGDGACITDGGAPADHAVNTVAPRVKPAPHATKAARGKAPALAFLGEQECAQRMQRVWPTRVEVLNARVCNTPLWFEPAAYAWFHVGKHTHNDVIRDVVNREASTGRRSAACLGSTMFVCHAYNTHTNFRRQVIRQRLVAVSPTLRQMLTAQGEEYVTLTLPSNAARHQTIGGKADSSTDSAGASTSTTTVSASLASASSSKSGSPLADHGPPLASNGSSAPPAARLPTPCTDAGCCKRHPQAVSCRARMAHVAPRAHAAHHTLVPRKGLTNHPLAQGHASPHGHAKSAISSVTTSTPSIRTPSPAHPRRR